jgi:hypothetical protein
MVHTCSEVGGGPHGYKTTLAAKLAFLSDLPRDEPAAYSTSRSPLRWRLTRKVLISSATAA